MTGRCSTANLRYPTAAQWRSWRAVRGRWLGSARDGDLGGRDLAIFDAGENAGSRVLVALDGISSTLTSALLRPAEVLRSRDVGVVLLAPSRLGEALTARGFIHRVRMSPTHLPELDLRAVLASQHCAGAGALAWEIASGRQLEYCVVQHGVITPFAPPLPPQSRVFAWSEDDAQFWSEGSADVQITITGSQLLWEARRLSGNPVRAVETACFLGQLHGPELDRRVTSRTIAGLRRMTEVLYRPHPDEVDLRSRAEHLIWRARGVQFISGKTPLAQAVNDRKVVGVYSTGILEAAAAGHEAFAYCIEPPEWVRDLWVRYAMAPYGEGAGTVVEVPVDEPALRIADEIVALL